MPKTLIKWAFFVFLDFIKLCVYISIVKRTWEHNQRTLTLYIENRISQSVVIVISSNFKTIWQFNKLSNNLFSIIRRNNYDNYNYHNGHY